MSRQERIYLTAKANIGDESWAKGSKRQAKRNDKVCFTAGEWKCNLFVYEVILAAGYDIGTPNKTGLSHPILNLEGKNERPPCAIDWYNKTVGGMEFIGEGDDGKKNCKEGDIITDGTHMGIVAGNNTTISAGEFEILHNDWGFRGNENRPVRIFRCTS